MQRYWGSKMIEHNITCTTFDGEVLNVEPGSIRVIDKRWKGASHCICGKAIRYEYWIQQYGPIGSVHITEHTNLDKTLVRDITNGYKKQNEVRTDIVKILADLKEQGKTFEDWKRDYDLSEKLKALPFLKNLERRQLIEGLVSLELPLPESLRRELALAEYFYRQSQTTPQGLVVPAAPLTSHQYLIDDLKSLLQQYDSSDCRLVSSSFYENANQLVNELETNTATIERIEQAKRAVNSLREAVNDKKPAGWKTIQKSALEVLKAILEKDPNHRFVKSLHAQAERGSLSIAQLDTIYTPIGSLNRPGLYYQHESIMTIKNLPAFDPKDYR